MTYIFDQQSALVLIDVQKTFHHPDWGKRNNPDAEQRIQALLAAWREKGLPVFHVRHASAHPQGLFREGESSFDFKPEAEPLPGEPIYKKSVNSAFIGTHLESDLRAKGIQSIILAGLTTNHCVSTTARMSGNLGFDTYVVEDATATFDRRGLNGEMRPASEVHASALSDLSGEFATIVSTADVIDAVKRAASHPTATAVQARLA